MMKNIMNRIEKSDITYLFTLGIFVVVGIFRFFDEKMNFHEAPWEFLHNYGVNKLAFVCLIGSMFLFFAVCILKIQIKNKKTLYYLCAFLSIFVCPMFATIEYFGSMDMFAWILMFVSAICFICGNLVWITIPLSFLMMYICPMSAFTCGCLLIAMCLYEFFTNTQKKYFLIAILNFIAASAGVLLSITQNGLYTDAQRVLSLKQFCVMGIMLSPYLCIAYYFLKGLMKENAKKIFGVICVILGALPLVFVNVYIGDYARAIIYTFIYFTVFVMCFIGKGHEDVIYQMDETKKKIKEWVPIPAVIIAYPLLFITFWIAGPIVLFTEVFTG